METVLNIVFMLLFLCLATVVGISSYNQGNLEGYKQGQVDCLNNKIEYQLQTNEDQTVEWVRKGNKE